MDLDLIINNERLNVRVGVIISYNDNIMIEYNNKISHQIVPGGRVKINESSRDALIREIKEELDFDLDSNRIIKSNVIENFFDYNNLKTHEIYFIYKYILTKDEYDKLSLIKTSLDNKNCYYKFINKKDIDNINVLPISLKNMIKKNKIKKEKSCGAFILKNNKVLIVKQLNNTWSIPKGHIEGNEKEEETALREIKEETNLDVEILNGFREVITYCPDKYDTIKDVVVFLSKPISNDIVLQEEEISDYKWETLDNLKELFKGRSDEVLIDKLIKYLY